VKFCRSGARPVGIDSGLAEIRDVAQAILDGDAPSPAEVRGTRESRDMLDAFIDHVLSFVDVSALKPMRVVADTANGMGGLVVPALFDRLPMIELEVMYGELDGTFPNHPADPLQPANQRDLRARVVAGGFDIGLAFDGAADRVFIVDETGAGLSGSVTTAILAVAMLRDNPGSTILHNLICSKAVPETVSAHGGNPIRTRVGHSFIKTEMAETNAVFGGEHSAHYYFADNFRADSGLIASLLMISELARSGSTLSKMRMPFEPYVASGEINTTVDDPIVVIDRVREMYRTAVVDELDGLTVDAGDWWFNLRPSNSEPLLRLNLEAQDSASCDEHVAEVLSIITS
ncbi:MAG: phosphomannomutase/phosphoglucomutase, partial [Ilumatobacteraceae bacterium]